MAQSRALHGQHVLTAMPEETVVSVVWKPRENSQKSQALIFPATEEHPD